MKFACLKARKNVPHSNRVNWIKRLKNPGRATPKIKSGPVQKNVLKGNIAAKVNKRYNVFSYMGTIYGVYASNKHNI